MLEKNTMRISIIILTILTTCIDFSRNAALTDKDIKKYQRLLDGQGLYSPDDDVKILTAYNFKNEIYEQKYASLVEFYNSWCGFCMRFAPSWKALATDIKEWNDNIKIGAIDCSNDDNSQLCRDFEIGGYPTLRYFHENYIQGPNNIGVEVEKGEDVYSHKLKLIQRVKQEQKEGRAAQFPNILPFTSSKINTIYEGLPTETKFIFVIFENASTILGPSLALELRHVPNIVVKYVQNNTDLMMDVGVKNLPAVIALDSVKNIKILQEEVHSTDSARKAIKEFLAPSHIVVPDATTKGNIYTGKWIDANVPDMAELMEAREKENLRQRIKKMGDVVFQADLETALRYSFKLEVSSVKTISGERLKALIAYVSVLIKYFPFGIAGKEFLTDLKYKIIEAGEVLRGADVSAWIRAAEHEDRRVFSSPAQWLGCQGSSRMYRGYPCGLWTLFHYLTVSAAEHGLSTADPREVLDAMHGYIKNFFGCSDCSRHFQEMALKKDLNGVSSLDTAVLWLWMAHNDVSKRLSGDATEDPDFPKIQYPRAERCAVCRANNTWNLQEVIVYVKQVYSSINVRYIGSDTRVLHLGLEGSAGNGSAPFFIKSVDSSMCFMLYIGCFLLLILLIRLFLKRGYKKKMYVHDLLGKV